MKVAIIHDWLVNYGGAERVVEQMLKVYPQADIFTLVYNKHNMAEYFPPEKVHTSFLQKIPGAVKFYTKLLHLMPKAFENFDLSGYDLVIASSSCCAKGVITSPDVPFFAYIHSPMRYIWDLYFDYYKNSGVITKFFMNKIIPNMRKWDFISSQRIDFIAANSYYIARRIKKFWNRESKVIYPPVDTARLFPNGKKAENFYVVFSRFVSYKRIDLALKACAELNRNLIIIGSGGQEKELKLLASSYKNSKIIFTGRISDAEVKSYLQRCKALIFCAEEDFGIIPVEAQSCGRPVIAFGKGGALETIIEDKTGVFFKKQETQDLKNAILRFEELEKQNTFDSVFIAGHAHKFSQERFRQELQEATEAAVKAVCNYIPLKKGL